MGGRTRREKSSMRRYLGWASFAFMATWVCITINFVSRNREDDGLTRRRDDEVEGQGNHRQDSGIASLKLLEGLKGWDLVEKLHSIGVANPGELARLLEEEDPFEIAVDSPDRFQCPASEADRFSLPDIRDHVREKDFKSGEGFIYYQHLRKAGGTGFCEMAGRRERQNMPAREVPMYHCMPDNRGAMATPPWSDKDFLLEKMKKNGHRITANEWDAFPMSHLTLPGAVFGTTFRHPVDRWYSQYRFEHVEHRDGSDPEKESMPFHVWYKRMRPYIMGDNYYVKTFCGKPNPPTEKLMQDLNAKGNPKHTNDLSWSYHKFNRWKDKVTWKDLEMAMEILRRFNLILILEFVDDEMWALEEALGWTQARKQVLPHENQAKREVKKSISAKEALPSGVWSEILSANVFDLLLFHWAKRMYLERSACRTFDEEAILNLPPSIEHQQAVDA
ncbi:unnamed protein product [Ectocarpus sp. 12 AP-2014]